MLKKILFICTFFNDFSIKENFILSKKLFSDPSYSLISTVYWIRYTVLNPGQKRVHFEEPSAILKKGTFWRLGGKFKR